MNTNAAVGDKYVNLILVQRRCGTLCSRWTLHRCKPLHDTASRVKYLAGKLDAAANTADAGSDDWLWHNSSGTSFLVTANALVQTATAIGLLN